jgi:hypothetical protein
MSFFGSRFFFSKIPKLGPKETLAESREREESCYTYLLLIN